MIKAIFFDWGDTLAAINYRSADISKKLDDILAPYNLNWEKFFPYWRNFSLLRSKGDIKSDEEMFLQLNRVLQKEIPLQKIRETRINNHFVSKENIEVIKKLKEKYKVGVLSNGVKDWVEGVMKRYGINNLFDSVITSSEVGIRKPDAEIYYIALKSLSLKPEETVFVSDEVCDDLIGAKGCGIKTIWLDTKDENEWKKKEREIARTFKPDAIVRNLREVIPLLKDL